MNLALTEDQTLIRDAAESFLADHSDSAAVRRAMATPVGFEDVVWQKIGSELGWCALVVPEAQGGMGLGRVELALVMEQMGRRLACAPFFSTVVLAAALIEQVGTAAAQAQWLPQIAAGSLRMTAALPDSLAGWRAASVKAQRSGEGWVLDGQLARVPDGASSQTLLVAADTGQGVGLFAVPANVAGLETTALRSWDETRRFATVVLHAVKIPEVARIDDPARAAAGFERAAAAVRLQIAAEQLGGAQACLDLTVAYAAGRKQFGRTIAGFQAVKHRCAEMMVRVEALRSAVFGAAAMAATDATGCEAAMAKALASDTFFYCAQEAIQLHGGVGFTWEYDPQLYFKRAQASSHWLGSADDLREYIASQVIA